jgi:hypothetical protein
MKVNASSSGIKCVDDVLEKNPDLVLRINKKGGATAKIDFSRLGLRVNICRAFQRALVGEFGHTELDTQRRVFHGLQFFADSLREAGCADCEILPADCAQQYARWLDKSSLGSSAQWYLNEVTRLLKWCQRNIPQILSARATFIVPRIRLASNGNREIASEDLLKKILKACYEDIEAIERKVARGKSLRTGDGVATEDQNARVLIQRLLELGNGLLPSQNEVKNVASNLRRPIDKMGGFLALGAMLWISVEDVFPFFLAILTQTGANAGELPNMARDCVIPHPLRTDLEIIKWPKNRSKKEQRAEFPIGRSWSAPNIARRLMVLNDELIGAAPTRGKNLAFLCFIAKEREVKVPRKYSLNKALSCFIERHGLPEFKLKNLRRSNGVLHYKEGHSIEIPRRRLNHSDSRTTETYCAPHHRGDEHDLSIMKFQGEFVRVSLEPSVGRSKSTDRKGGNRCGTAAETLFGFQCVDIYAGIAPGSKVGEICPFFTGCAFCPGALVPVNDPVIVARLLESLEALNDARERSIREGWFKRYQELYEPTREILASEIIPAIHESVLRVARTLALPRLVPFLE